MTTEQHAMIDHLHHLASAKPVDAEMLTERLRASAPPAAMMLTLDDMQVDFSRQCVDHDQWQALVDWGQSILPKRDAMLAGEIVNISENRPALHAHLRNPDQPMAQENITNMAAMTDTILGLGVEDVVAIGIGGSYLGPKMAVEALAPFHQGPEVHFVSNIDPSHLDDLLAGLNPITTAVIAISKTFTTKETMSNVSAAEDWFQSNGVSSQGRVIAVTSRPDVAKDRGIADHLILPMDEGIGGRFSLWSAVGLPIMVAIGAEMFTAMIAGASQMDDHFASAPVAENIPILAGLIRVWNRAFLGRSGLAVIPYDQRLNLLPSWLQQLEMESNGKAMTADGKPQPLGTSPIVFGEAGSNVQHSFFQMIHQSQDIVPVDFLAPLEAISLTGDASAKTRLRHRDLIAQMLAQADCLAMGDAERGFTGGRPSTVVTWQETSPFALGRLLAYYEHITAVSGWLLNLNSFDQPGVELGKVIARQYEDYMDNGSGGDHIPTISRHILDRYRS
jgi:glucose-6-phosphate isomerase